MPEISQEELDKAQHYYKAAVDAWIATIRHEAALASVHHSVVALDKWEQAHFDEEKARKRAQDARDEYENALRKEFYNF